MTAAPDGFMPISVASEYIAAIGPLWMNKNGGRLQFGFHVETRHTNVMRMCHGGMIATFCDMLLTLTARAHSHEMEHNFMSTINLQIDYIAPAALGAWIGGEGQVLRPAGRILFMQGLITADDTLIARTSGILKVGKPLHDSALRGQSA